MARVMVFGTFDGLHEGHLDFFRQARKYGDYLIAVAGRDKNIKKLKKRSPKRNEQERLQDLKNCKLVNESLLGYESDPYQIIEDIKPDVICLGYDQGYYADNLENEIKKRGLHVKIYRLKPYKPDQFHSSIFQ